jgi:hypothetical protein
LVSKSNMRIRDSKLGLEIKLGIEINPSWSSLVLDSTILENIPMESNHQLNRNITLSDVAHTPPVEYVPWNDDLAQSRDHRLSSELCGCSNDLLG